MRTCHKNWWRQTRAIGSGKSLFSMGQRQAPSVTVSSSSASGEQAQEQQRGDQLTLWPGLETQLELSFNSLDVEGEGALPYDTLEPALRHHLMQIGLIEYVTRFALPDGKLDEKEITNYLHEYKIDLNQDLDVLDWKNLMLCWIRRVEHAQHDDICNWQDSMRALQESQVHEYQIAMKQFQQHYINQLEAYYRAVDSVHQKEEQYRKEWEASLALQEEFHNTQMRYVQERNEEALEEYTKQVRHEQDLRAEYMRHLKTKVSSGPGNISIISYAYPADLTEAGAPISGGCPIPYRRAPRARESWC